MSIQQILQWRDGRGMLIFSGGNTAGSPIRAAALSKTKDYGHIAYISTADDLGDSLMDDMEDLGARSGFYIDPVYEDEEELVDELKIASLVVIEVGSSIDALYQVIQGAIQDGLEQAYERGAVILVEGLAVNLFGRWVVSDRGDVLDGLNWVQDTFIEPESVGIQDSRAVQAVMQAIPNAVAINIASGSALALGDAGNIELLGDQQVTISLGKHYLQKGSHQNNTGN